MSRLDDTSPEFQALLAAACGEDATPEQLQALELLAADPASMRLLVDYVQLDAELRRLVRRQSNADKCLAGLGIGSVDAASCGVVPGCEEEPAEAGTTSTNLSASAFPQIGPGPFALPPAPPPGVLGGAWQATADFFQVGGLPFSYLVGTVIFATALWAFSWITVSPPGSTGILPVDVAGTGLSPSSTGILPVDAPHADQPPLVARITGTADCRWADPDNVPSGSVVPLGGKYALRSGLLEIAYNSGARVILQGPCTYEVESTTGGYLSLGKLTARVESAKQQAANPKSQIPNQEISNPQSAIPNPLFTVRTPTALVTDLGTEFGVEVDEQGAPNRRCSSAR